jgi:hypothetical protein
MTCRANGLSGRINVFAACGVGVATILLATVTPVVRAEPCAGWEVRLPGSGPGRLSEHALGYHAGSGEVVLFGGFDEFSLINETWTFDGTTWSQVFPASAPTARRGAALAPAAGSSDLVLFGGEDSNGPRNDTWIWNGSTWTLRTPTPPITPPPARSFAALASLEGNPSSRTLLFGGFGDDGTAFNDTYLLAAGDKWLDPGSQLDPPARGAAAMAYDHNRNVTVLFGGADGVGNELGDTWEFDHLAPWEWRPVATATAPPARAYHMMAWDPQRETVVMYGGNAGGVVFSDAWEFDGARWLPLPLSGGSDFPQRSAGRIAYDQAANELVLYGGSDGTQGQQDTQVRDLAAIASPVIADHPQPLVLPATGSAQFNVTASGSGLNYQWRKDGVALTNGGGIAGATSSLLTITPIGATGFGYYDVVVTSGCASVTSEAAALIESGNLPGDHLSPPDQSADTPDDGFTDSNGDGIDGMRVGPIFVSADIGSDANLGTIEAPLRTIGAAILAAQSRTPVRDVYIAGGEYRETVTLASGVNLYGGYDHASGWARSSSPASRPVIRGGRVAVWAANLTSPTRIDRLEIRSEDNFTPGKHTIGLVALDNASDLFGDVVCHRGSRQLRSRGTRFEGNRQHRFGVAWSRRRTRNMR